MTTQNNKPDLFVVDGSNIATEGRSQPSLEQLNEAVAAFAQEFPDVKVTVVVDATFGHRIAKKEVKAFDAAVANNELVTPPAGAVGRGDAFILAIANKAGAGVFSNDSFQEFHGDYEWLFANGRLIGGKPVPHVGWVFVDRNPVRGPRSRESIRAAKKAEADEPPTAAKDRAKRRVRKKRAASSDAEGMDEPPTPTSARTATRTATPTPTRTRTSTSSATTSSDASSSSDESTALAAAPAPRGKHVNDVVPFLEFVEAHPVGTSTTGTVESYSSHGAYAQVGDALVYIPLRLMGDPAPTSARKVLKLGDEVELVIAAYAPERRSIDAALPAMATAVAPNAAEVDRDDVGDGDDQERPAKRRASRRRGRNRSAEGSEQQQPERSESSDRQATESSDMEQPPTTGRAPRRRGRKQDDGAGSDEPTGESSGDEAPVKPAAKRRSPAKKKAAAKKAPAKKSPAKKPAAKKKAAAKQPASPAPKKKAAAKRAPAKRKAAAKKKAAAAPAEQSDS